MTSISFPSAAVAFSPALPHLGVLASFLKEEPPQVVDIITISFNLVPIEDSRGKNLSFCQGYMLFPQRKSNALHYDPGIKGISNSRS